MRSDAHSDTCPCRGREACGSSYQLVSLAASGALGGWRRLGSFPDLDSTLRAQVDDVLSQLAANDGWLVTCEYLVIGPGPDGVVRVSTAVTQVGADPASEHVPAPYDERDTRRWLLAAAGVEPAP